MNHLLLRSTDGTDDCYVIRDLRDPTDLVIEVGTYEPRAGGRGGRGADAPKQMVPLLRFSLRQFLTEPFRDATCDHGHTQFSDDEAAALATQVQLLRGYAELIGLGLEAADLYEPVHHHGPLPAAAAAAAAPAEAEHNGAHQGDLLAEPEGDA